LFDGKEQIITEKTGQIFVDWLNSGVEPTPKVTAPVVSQFVSAMRTVKSEIGDKKYFEILNKAGYKDEDEVDKLDRAIQSKIYKELKSIKNDVLDPQQEQEVA